MLLYIQMSIDIFKPFVGGRVFVKTNERLLSAKITKITVKPDTIGRQGFIVVNFEENSCCAYCEDGWFRTDGVFGKFSAKIPGSCLVDSRARYVRGAIRFPIPKSVIGPFAMSSFLITENSYEGELLPPQAASL